MAKKATKAKKATLKKPAKKVTAKKVRKAVKGEVLDPTRGERDHWPRPPK